MDSIVWAALISAGALIVGVILGGRISSESAKTAAKISADVMKEVSDATRFESQADREAARAARLTERLITLASDVLARSERHRHEIWVQSRGWSRAAVGKDKPESIPDVSPTDAIVDGVGGIYIVGRQETADAAWDLYRALRDGMDRHVYDHERDRSGDVVRRRTDDEILALNAADLEYQARKTAFLNRVRIEVGLPELEPSAPVFPDDEDAASSPAPPAFGTIGGSAYTPPPGS